VTNTIAFVLPVLTYSHLLFTSTCTIFATLRGINSIIVLKKFKRLSDENCFPVIFFVWFNVLLSSFLCFLLWRYCNWCLMLLKKVVILQLFMHLDAYCSVQFNFSFYFCFFFLNLSFVLQVEARNNCYKVTPFIF